MSILNPNMSEIIEERKRARSNSKLSDNVSAATKSHRAKIKARMDKAIHDREDRMAARDWAWMV